MSILDSSAILADPFFNAEDSPYIGLRTFEALDRRYFCGRTTHVAEILQRLHDHRFVAVVGLSGSGKSSLVRAGVIPELRANHLKDSSSDWLIAMTTPETEPLNRMGEQLRTAVKRYYAEKRNDNETDIPPNDEVERWAVSVQNAVSSGSLGLAKAIATAGLRERTSVLLVVDQFEELFRYWKRTSRDGKDEIEVFIQQLLELTSDPAGRVYVVITMRSEYMGDCALYEGLAEAVNAGLYLTPRLDRNQLREAIALPAQKCNGKITEELVQRLLNDVANDQDQLPVLQHALMRSWQQALAMGNITIGEAQYDDIGGSKALNKHAEEVFGKLGEGSADEGEKSRQIAEAVFKRITKLASRDGGAANDPSRTDGTRDPASLVTICSQTGLEEAEVREIIDVFRERDCAFLRPDLGTKVLTPRSMIDITHESLIRKWDRLGKWVQEEAKSAAAYMQLADDASEASANEVLSERKVNIVLEESARWSANWAQRYGGRYEQTIGYLLKSQTALRKKELAEKEEEERRIESKLKQKQAKRARRLKNVAAGLVLSGLVLAFSAWVFVPPLLKNLRELAAETLAGEADQQASQFGALTQERAALLEIESVRTQPTPSNTNVSIWEGFGRITRGVPVEAVLQSMLKGQVHDLVTTKDGTINNFHVFVVSERQTDDTRQLLAFAMDGNTPKPSPGFLSGSKNTKVTAISSLGRYAATPCEKGHLNIYALGKPTTPPFRVDCVDTIRSIVDSLDSGRFATVESKEPTLEAPPLTPPDPSLNTIRVWEATGASICRYALQGSVMNVLISPDGNDIAMIERPANTRSQKFEMRRLEKACPLLPIPVPAGSVSQSAAMAFSHDNKFLAIGGQQGQVFLMRSDNGRGWIDASGVHRVELRKLRKTLDVHKEDSPAKTSPEEHAQAPTYFLPLHGNAPITAVAFGNRSNLLATAGADDIVRMSDPEAEPGLFGVAKILWSDDFAAAASELTFSRQDNFLGIALGESTARVKYAKSGVETARVTHLSRVSSIVFSFDERTALSASEGKNGEVFSFPTQKQELPISIPLRNCKVPQQAAESENGSVLAMSCSLPERSVSPLYKAVAAEVVKLAGSASATGDAVRYYPLDEAETPTPSSPPMCQVAVSANGALAAAECDGRITLFDVNSEKTVLQRAPLPGLSSVGDVSSPQHCHAVSIALNPDGTMLGVGDDCGAVWKFDTSSLSPGSLSREAKPYEVRNDRRGVGAITSIAFSHSSAMIAAGTSDGVLWLKALRPAEQAPFTRQYECSVSAIQFSPSLSDQDDSPTLIFGSGTTARIMRTRDHQILSEFFQKGNVRAVAFSTDGQRAAAGTINGAVTVVDLSSPGWQDRIRFSLFKALEPWTHYDPFIVRVPAFGLSAIPGWVLPPSVKYDGAQKIYTLRFVGGDQLEVGADSVGVIEAYDRADSLWFLSLTTHDLSVFDNQHLGSLCRQLREDVSGAYRTKYQEICTNELLSAARPSTVGSSR